MVKIEKHKKEKEVLRRDHVMSNLDHLSTLEARAWKTGASFSIEILE